MVECFYYIRNYNDKMYSIQKNYLTGVIFRINFSNILQLSGKNKESAEKFQKEIFDKFKFSLLFS